MELHKRRRTLTEPETRYYLKQIVEGTMYMHARKVIHRDLKLGNLFLDSDLKIKIGDFGLATTVEYEGERKKTLCGTPNYIAPEILDRKCGGHSYEVDVWSIGCIMYTLLFGRPPFETSSIDSTYRRIRNNEYHMSSSANVSEPARDLIRWMLAAKPSDRPTMEQIIGHTFFGGYTPDSLPVSSLTKVPSFPAGAVSAGAVASRALGGRTALGSVDVNSPAATSGGTKKKAYSKPSMPVAPASKYTTHPASADRDHSLQAVLHSLQKLVGEQARAAPSAIPKPVSESVAATSTWISKWVDYSNKYGLGYQLSDGSVGVLFNDSTKMVLSADQSKIESIERSAAGHVVTHLTLTDFPATLTKKVTLLKYFQSYMNKNLLNGGNGSPTPADTSKRDDMMHVKKWIRTSQAIVFRLSQGVIQINFFDHAKVIFNAPLGLITFVDKTRETNTYSVRDIGKANVSDTIISDLIERLPYAVEVVNKMISGTKSASSKSPESRA
jgi:polo-like kinase 1